jgi:dipeptidyl aminopeptidase/acylaminoacyl peptidase
VTDGAGGGDVSIERGVKYGREKLADIYLPRRNEPAPLAVLWHGVGPDDRATLGPLATAVARLGVAVVVPDWRSDAADGGRAHLLASLDFTKALAGARPAELATDAGSFVLAGWSRGGRMATSLALNPAVAGGWRPSAVVCLAAGFYRATPMSLAGKSPIDDLAATRAQPVPFQLIHGTRDTVVGVQESRDFAAAAVSHGWPVRLAEPDTDHGGVVKTGDGTTGFGLLSARTIASAAAR